MPAWHMRKRQDAVMSCKKVKKKLVEYSKRNYSSLCARPVGQIKTRSAVAATLAG